MIFLGLNGEELSRQWHTSGGGGGSGGGKLAGGGREAGHKGKFGAWEAAVVVWKKQHGGQLLTPLPVVTSGG